MALVEYQMKVVDYQKLDTSMVKPIQCVHPYVLRLPNMQYPAAFPCNNCPLCLARRSYDWGNRIELESLTYSPENVCFCTLTYAPEYESKIRTPSGFLTLNYLHIQLFLKRLRKYLPYKIRFFCCGEYGSLRGRPHYHLIIFGLKPTDHPFVDLAWGYGIVDTQVAGIKAFQYVAKYMTKFDVLPKSDEQFPQFFRSSKGLGRDFVKSVIDNYKRDRLVEVDCLGNKQIKPYMFLNGRKVLIPKYCIKKLREHFLSESEIRDANESFLKLSQESFFRIVGTWFGLPSDIEERRVYVSEKYMAHHYAKYLNILNKKQKLKNKGWYDGV